METNEPTNVQIFRTITDKMIEIYKAKNHDYGDSFSQSLDKFGLVASAVRMNDKLNRFSTLIKQDAKVADEKITDTLLDLANYAIMTEMYMYEKELE